MTQRRLLIVTTVPGTMRHFLTPFAEHFRAQGWQVDAATGDVPDGVPDDVRDAFDRAWTVPWSRNIEDVRNWTSATRAVRQLLVRGQYDVVHTHTPVASFVTRVVVGTLPRHRRPVVVYTAHGFHFHPRGSTKSNVVFRGAERVAGHWTDRLVVLNQHDLDAARSARLVDPAHIALVPGVGIDLDYYSPTQGLLDEAARLRTELGIGEHQPLFSVVAELQPGKDHVTVVRALAEVRDLDPVLACAGRGPRMEAIVTAAQQAGVADRVHMLGSVKDVRPLVLASTATVLASHREGLSRAVLESLALGVPVIGSRVRGIADLVTTPESGVLVEPGDVPGFAVAMRSVIGFPAPPEVRKQLEPGLHKYALASILAQHEDLYERALADKEGPVRLLRPWRSPSR